MTRWGPRVLLASAMLTGSAVVVPAVAADDGYQNVFSSVLGAVGLLKTETSPEIDYRERAPLVLPPKMALAKPVPAGAARTAAWPQDPDVIKRRRAAEDARAPMPNVLGNPREELSKAELMKGRIGDGQGSPVKPNYCGNTGNQRNCLVVSQDELDAEHQHYLSENKDSDRVELRPGDEPERKYLTEPPKGYRMVTRTVKASTEAPQPRIDNANPKAALIYKEKTDDE